MNKAVNILLALFLPPVGVYLKAGLCWHLALNVFLCFAFFLPAVVHAVWFVARSPGRRGDADAHPEAVDDTPESPRERREPSLS
jgi:uncharacterized membrane protein YqaE (UPF0057 family)